LLTKFGFSFLYLKENLIPFVSAGVSVTLGWKSSIVKLFLNRFLNASIWHCATHRLEVGLSHTADESMGLNDL
jgi:hypothetical protein